MVPYKALWCRSTSNAGKILIHDLFYDSADYPHENRKNVEQAYCVDSISGTLHMH